MIRFKSQATPDVVMPLKTAEALLHLVGKHAGQPGIIEVPDMPRVLEALRGAPDELHELPEEVDKMNFADQPVSLRKHAAPLVRMIEQAQAEDKPVVWGV